MIQIRRAKAIDCLNVYNLAVSQDVRANSSNKELFSFESHIRFFMERINNKDCVFLVVASKGRFIGYIRLDIWRDGYNSAVINLALKKDCRGKGYGMMAVKKTVKFFWAFRKNNDVPSIVAIVKKKNVASNKLFKHSGFTLFHKYKDASSGEDMNKYCIINPNRKIT